MNRGPYQGPEFASAHHPRPEVRLRRRLAPTRVGTNTGSSRVGDEQARGAPAGEPAGERQALPYDVEATAELSMPQGIREKTRHGTCRALEVAAREASEQRVDTRGVPSRHPDLTKKRQYGSGYGSGLNRMPSTSAKTAVDNAVATATTTMAPNEYHGVRRSARSHVVRMRAGYARPSPSSEWQTDVPCVDAQSSYQAEMAFEQACQVQCPLSSRAAQEVRKAGVILEP
jgi:hypothetical protein